MTSARLKLAFRYLDFYGVEIKVAEDCPPLIYIPSEWSTREPRFTMSEKVGQSFTPLAKHK